MERWYCVSNIVSKHAIVEVLQKYGKYVVFFFCSTLQIRLFVRALKIIATRFVLAEHHQAFVPYRIHVTE
jgi:hypothetical protein